MFRCFALASLLFVFCGCGTNEKPVVALPPEPGAKPAFDSQLKEMGNLVPNYPAKEAAAAAK